MKNEKLVSENVFIKEWKDRFYEEYEEYIPKLVIKSWIENSDFLSISERKVNIFNVESKNFDGNIYYDIFDLEKKYEDQNLLKYDVLTFFKAHFENRYSPEEYYAITSEVTKLGNQYGMNFNEFDFEDAIDISIILYYSEAKTMKLLQDGSLIIVKNITSDLPRYILDPIKLNSGNYLIQPF